MFSKGMIILSLIIIIMLKMNACMSSLCIEEERQALLKIEKDIHDPHHWFSSWRKGGDCCQWNGIFCNDTTGHVVQLDLPSQRSMYTDDDDDGKKQGETKLNPSLIHLKHLTYLSLTHNIFRGPIPGFIGSLTSLEVLNIEDSGFEGVIHPQLGNLSNLQVLRINCSCSVDSLHWLSTLTSLTHLEMYDVNMSAAVDWVHDIIKLPFLSSISLYDNGLTYIPMTIPSSNFTFLQTFDLSGNQLNSTIPSWLFYNTSSLKNLYLRSCGLYGELPLFHGQVNNLISLDLRRNEFDGQVFGHLDKLPLLEDLDISYNNANASLSENLWNLTHLSFLDLRQNQIHGSLPTKLESNTQLHAFLIAANNISGEISHSIGNLTNLLYLQMDDNNIGGKIPDSIGNLKMLSSFSIKTNHLNGELPKSLMGLKELTYLDLSNNRLSGPLFQTNSSLLMILDLSNNSFSGTIPDSFEFYYYLQTLKLGKNNLYGLIPSSLKYCTKLEVFDLSDNELNGHIPPWIGENLSLLRILNLRTNNLTGQIPKELSYLTFLQILDLSQNNLSGNFSLYFLNFTIMTAERKASIDSLIYTGWDSYQESIWINKENARLYTSTLYDAIVIDISSNNLSGEISNEIIELVGLIFLNMSQNHFIGSIPKNISQMKSLEMLDLSSNDLLGEIPSIMTEMTSLSVLNLSNNKLSGKIPSGNQFGSFNDPSIYSGNNDLCGLPLLECPMPNNTITMSESEEIEEHEYWYETKWINIGTAIGFLISFWGFYITLRLNRTLRDSYFYYVDILYEWIALKFDLIIVKMNRKVTEIEMNPRRPNE